MFTLFQSQSHRNHNVAAALQYAVPVTKVHFTPFNRTHNAAVTTDDINKLNNILHFTAICPGVHKYSASNAAGNAAGELKARQIGC